MKNWATIAAIDICIQRLCKDGIQSYSIGGRDFTRIDLGELRRLRKLLMSENSLSYRFREWFCRVRAYINRPPIVIDVRLVRLLFITNSLRMMT